MTSGINPSDSPPSVSSISSSLTDSSPSVSSISSSLTDSSPSSNFSLQGQAMSTTQGFQDTLTKQFMENGKNNTPPITQAQAEEGANKIVQSIMMTALQSLQQFASNALQQQKQNESDANQ